MSRSAKIKHNFKKYLRYKSTEYLIKAPLYSSEYKKSYKERKQGYNVFLRSDDFICNGFERGNLLDKSLVDRFHPDKIDNKLFWQEAIKAFRFLPIAGSESKNVDEVNSNNLKLSESIGAKTNLLEVMNNLSFEEEESVMVLQKKTMLEIGPGYGNIYELAKDHSFEERYYSIDINPLFKHPNGYECDGRNIPTEIPNELDLVYSINVFQHLSKSQRSSYYRQIFEKLKKGGRFLFSMFLEAEMNTNLPLWGFRDKNGRSYCQFFGQFTEVDKLEEILQELEQVGFDKVKIDLPQGTNRGYFICNK